MGAASAKPAKTPTSAAGCWGAARAPDLGGSVSAYALDGDNAVPSRVDSTFSKARGQGNRMQPAPPRGCSWDETSYDSSSRSLPDFVNPFAAHRPSVKPTGAHADGLPQVCMLSSTCTDSKSTSSAMQCQHSCHVMAPWLPGMNACMINTP